MDKRDFFELLYFNTPEYKANIIVMIGSMAAKLNKPHPSPPAS